MLARFPQPMKLAEKTAGKVRQSVQLKDFAAETGLALQAFVIQQHGASDDGLLREWPRPDVGVHKHASYAVQWYSLAGLAVVLFVVLSFRRVGAP